MEINHRKRKRRSPSVGEIGDDSTTADNIEVVRRPPFKTGRRSDIPSTSRDSIARDISSRVPDADSASTRTMGHTIGLGNLESNPTTNSTLQGVRSLDMEDKALTTTSVYQNQSAREHSQQERVADALLAPASGPGKHTSSATGTASSLNLENGSFVPFALYWTEHELDLRPVESLKRSEDPETTQSPFPNLGHSCSPVPDSAGNFIIFGGCQPWSNLSGTLGTNETFLLSLPDRSLTRLETVGDKPAARFCHRAVISGRVLVVFGGTSSDSKLHFLPLETREWSSLRPPAPYPCPRFGHSFILVDDTLWVYGGARANTLFDDMWCINLNDLDNINSIRWRQVPKQEPWPGARSYHSTVYYDGCLYLFGGRAKGPISNEVVNETWRFDILTETWAQVQCTGSFPQERITHSATVVGDNMFIYGGLTEGAQDNNDDVRDDAYVLNFGDCTWRSLAIQGTNPLPTTSGVMSTLGSRLILVGGQKEGKTCFHEAEIQIASYVKNSLTKLQFTTETTHLRFTAEPMDLSRLVRKQGNGAYSIAGFSDVWRGEMTETGQQIAIKVLRMAGPGVLSSEDSRRLRTRFDRELSIWMECQHPRVLELLGYAYIEEIPCLISPWCSNGNIMEHLRQHPDANRLQLVIQVAEGLVYLHGREPPVVHSDVKPANVLISDTGEAKICDFGISKLMMDAPSGWTTTKSANWTLRYSSKELLCGGKNTATSDVFAFGMFVLEVTTDKAPFFEITVEPMIVMTIMNGNTPAPKDYPELPDADPLWDVMRKCWKEEPTERPTMVEVLDEVRRAPQML